MFLRSLLEEVFELNMALEDLRAPADEIAGARSSGSRTMRDEIDAGDAASSSPIGFFVTIATCSVEIRGPLNRRRYVRI